MLSLSVKEIRDVLGDTLFKFYALADFSMSGTKTTNAKEFRIELRIYDTELWMTIDSAIDSIRIATKALGVPDAIDSIQMRLTKPFEYDKSKFEFGWRKDLEVFFDAFHTALLEKLAKTQKANMAAVYGSSTKADETKKTESSIFNNLKDAEAKEAKTSIFNGLKEDKEDE